MREYKFRAWDFKVNQFIKFSLKTMVYNRFTFREIVQKKELEIWQQYVGFKDIDGEEIYEGDIVECISSIMNDTQIHKVEFVDGMWGVSWDGCFGIFRLSVFDNTKILGNIYENPELLK